MINLRLINVVNSIINPSLHILYIMHYKVTICNRKRKPFEVKLELSDTMEITHANLSYPISIINWYQHLVLLLLLCGTTLKVYITINIHSLLDNIRYHLIYWSNYKAIFILFIRHLIYLSRVVASFYLSRAGGLLWARSILWVWVAAVLPSPDPIHSFSISGIHWVGWWWWFKKNFEIKESKGLLKIKAKVIYT